MSPQLRPRVPGPSHKSSFLHCTHVSLRPLWLHTGAFAHDLRWLREEEDFQGQMPRAARQSSWRSDSTYPQKAHNEGQCIKQQDLTRALEGRSQELGGSRPLLRKPIDCHWEKRFKDLSRVLGLPKCQGAREINYGDLKSLHVELQNRCKHPLQSHLSVIKNFWANLNTLTGAPRGWSQLGKSQLCMVLIAFPGALVTKVSIEHRNWHAQHLNLGISSNTTTTPTSRLQIPYAAGLSPLWVCVSWLPFPSDSPLGVYMQWTKCSFGCLCL